MAGVSFGILFHIYQCRKDQWRGFEQSLVDEFELSPYLRHFRRQLVVVNPFFGAAYKLTGNLAHPLPKVDFAFIELSDVGDEVIVR